jgi:hypothetical protein
MLSLKMHFKWIVSHEIEWPRAMKLIAEQMPALRSLKLWTRFHTNQPPLRETSGGNRTYQEIRALERFGAFFILRMLEMKFLIRTLPREEGGSVHISIKLLKDAPKQSKMTEHRILHNTRSLRIFTWDELLEIPPTRFKIDPRSETSETGEYAKFSLEDCARIDDMAYMTRKELRSKGCHANPRPDTLIHQDKANAVRRAREEHEHKEREENTQANIAALAAWRTGRRGGRFGQVLTTLPTLSIANETLASLSLPQWGSVSIGKDKARSGEQAKDANKASSSASIRVPNTQSPTPSLFGKPKKGRNKAQANGSKWNSAPVAAPPVNGYDKEFPALS